MNKGVILRCLVLLLIMALTFCCSSNMKDSLFPKTTSSQVPAMSKSRLTVSVKNKEFMKAIASVAYVNATSKASCVRLEPKDMESYLTFASLVNPNGLMNELSLEYNEFVWNETNMLLELPRLQEDRDYVQVPTWILVKLVEMGYFQNSAK